MLPRRLLALARLPTRISSTLTIQSAMYCRRSFHRRSILHHSSNRTPNSTPTTSILIKDEWTAEEDLALQVAVQKYGANWSKINSVLPEKTPLQLKTRWKFLMQTWRRETHSDREVFLSIFYWIFIIGHVARKNYIVARTWWDLPWPPTRLFV